MAVICLLNSMPLFVYKMSLYKDMFFRRLRNMLYVAWDEKIVFMMLRISSSDVWLGIQIRQIQLVQQLMQDAAELCKL
jgi:squalene cyclase